MIFNNYNNSQDDIMIDESVSEGMTGAYETMLWIEEENRKFMEECVSLDVQEIVLGEDTEAFNEGAGEWIKNRLNSLKEFVKKVFGKIIGFLKKTLEKIKGLFKKSTSSNTAAPTKKLEDIPDSEAVTGDRYIEVTDKKFVCDVLNDVSIALVDEGRKVCAYALQNKYIRADSMVEYGKTAFDYFNSKSSLFKGFTKEDAADIGNYLKNRGAVTEKSKFTASEAKSFAKDSGEKYIKVINNIISKANQASKSLTAGIDKMRSEVIADGITGLVNEYSARVTKGCNLLTSICGQYINMINKEISDKRKMTNKLISQYNKQ